MSRHTCRRNLHPARGCEDDRLMARSAEGDREAFGRLVARHRNWLIGFASRRLGDPEAGECASQVALLRLWQHRQTYEARGRFIPFLRLLCTNACREAHRSNHRRGLAMERLAVTESSQAMVEGADCAVEESQRARHLRTAISRLRPILSAAVHMRYLLDLSYAQMAELTGCPEGTLRSRVHHGITQLRSLLGGGCLGKQARSRAPHSCCVSYQRFPASGPIVCGNGRNGRCLTAMRLWNCNREKKDAES